MKKYAVFGILALAFIVRLALLDQSFWLDEAAQAIESVRPLHQQLEIAHDFQPPLYHLFVHFFARIGTSEAWLRTSSVFAGLVTVVAAYFTAQVVWKGKTGKQIGLVAALFMAISPLHIFYSQELRPYMFAAMWAAVSWLVLLKYLESRRLRFIRLFVLFTAAGLYSMYVYPFLFLSQLAYVWFVVPSARRSIMIATGVVVALFLPWAPSFLEQLQIGSALRVSLPGWSEVVSSPQWKALPLVWFKFVGGLQNIDLTLGSTLYFGLPTIGLLVAGFTLLKKKKSVQELRPVIFWLVVTVLGSWLVSFIVPVISVKRVLLVLPAFYLLIAAALVQIREQRWRTYAIVAFMVFELVGLWSYWTVPALQREDWRTIHGQIYDNYSAESTVVVFAFDAPFAPWRWYDRDEMFMMDTVVFPAFPLSEPSFSQTMEQTLSYRSVLVFDYLRDLTDPSRQIDAWLVVHGYEPGAIINTQNLGFVREYRRGEFVSLRQY